MRQRGAANIISTQISRGGRRQPLIEISLLQAELVTLLCPCLVPHTCFVHATLALST